MRGLISRKQTIDALRTCYDTERIDCDNGKEYIDYEQALDLIKELPSADVPDTNVGDINCTDCIKHGGDWECDHVNCHKGKKGRWLMNGERYGHMYWRCSQCGEEVDYIGANFCPNCGSYNGGEQSETD